MPRSTTLVGIAVLAALSPTLHSPLLVDARALGPVHTPSSGLIDDVYRQRAILPTPYRPLEWGDVNFLSTSDTHGWLLGHQHATWPEPNYSGDYGALASFATHLRAHAAERGADILLVDAGDHHDGSGLVSSSASSATAADEIFDMLDYDVLTIGNHELYAYSSVKEIYDKRARWNGRYLTSNVNITVDEGEGAVSVPVADRYAKFETKQGRKVTAFGVLFDFQAHDRNITIRSPRLLAKETWFLEAIANAPDFFLLVGHMPARGETAEWSPIYDAIRAIHPRVPVFVFGGHTHVRDCVQYDDRSIAVVPGRYLETVAFTSSLLSDDDAKPLHMTRRYLDANPTTYKYHTGTTDFTFDTPLGWNITVALLQLASSLNISTPLGIVPHDLFLSRYPYGHPRSVVTVFAEQVLPAAVQDEKRTGPRVIIANAGGLRFDVFQGRFDRNDELTVSPFTSGFLYTRLPASLARNVSAEMNRAGASKVAAQSADKSTNANHDDEVVQRVFDEWMAAQWEDHISESLAGSTAEIPFDKWHASGLSRSENFNGAPSLGYVTRDACSGRGDDIEHVPIPYSRDQVDFIATPFPQLGDDDELDVVVMDFALDDFLTAVATLDPSRQLSPRDFEPYAKGTLANAVFGKYAAQAWAKADE